MQVHGVALIAHIKYLLFICNVVLIAASYSIAGYMEQNAGIRVKCTWHLNVGTFNLDKRATNEGADAHHSEVELHLLCIVLGDAVLKGVVERL